MSEEVFKKFETGDLLTAERLNHLGDGIRSVSSGGLMRHSRSGHHLDLYVSPQAVAAAANVPTFPCRLTDSKKMNLPKRICIEGTGLAEGTEKQYRSGPPVPHDYRWVYGFTEVTFVEQCFDAQGNDIPFKDCAPNTERYIKVEDKPSGRVGKVEWPGSGTVKKQKWAFNVWEILHKQDTEVCAEEPHWIFGANIKQNQYPPGFVPTGPGIGNDGDWPDNQDFMVLMYESLDHNGVPIRYFNAPGIHSGTCGA